MQHFVKTIVNLKKRKRIKLFPTKICNYLFLEDIGIFINKVEYCLE